MKQSLMRLIALFCLITAGSILAVGQGNTSSLSGTVYDANKAVVAGAAVTVISQASGAQLTATTGENGEFTIPVLDNGLYTIKVSANGFKNAEVKDFKVTVGVPANVQITLQVGGGGETVEVTATGDVLVTQTANVGNVVTGRQITELPFVSRNVMDLITNLPGTNTPGRTRTASVNGLPKGTLNITYDGINVQDNLLKSSDGFFTIIQPRVDAVDEVTLSSGNPGAESNAEGATQIKFVTKSGTNQYHGGTYWYQKNRALDANTYFNNLNHLPKQPILLNEGGFKVGGPVLKDKVLFFVNYERFLFPNSQSRSATIIDPSFFNGNFPYVDSNGVTQTVNLLTIAANQNAANTTANLTNGCVGDPTKCLATNFRTTIDPAIAKMLSTVNSAAHSSGTIAGTTNPLLDTLNFINIIGDKRIFFDQRFDINPTSKLHLENVYHYDKFTGLHPTNFDNLNTRDPAIPGILAGTGSQNSDRYADSFAVRYTINNSMVNEFRWGTQASRVRFFPEVNGTIPNFVSLYGAAFRVTTPLMTTPSRSPSDQQRNTPTTQFSDTFSWTRGSHNMNFGWTFTNIASYQNFDNNFIPSVGIGFGTGDANISLFSAATLLNSNATARSNAASLYALLIGNISSESMSAALQADGTYSLTKSEFENAHSREMGFFGQDSYRFRPNLTLNYGLRYEIGFPYYNPQGTFTRVVGGEQGLLGANGGNQVAVITPNTPSFNTETGLAPSFGLAWSPNFHFGDKGASGFLKKLFGESGQTVIRGGYSIAYDREGANNFYSIWGSNIGPTQSANISTGAGTIPIASGKGVNGGIGQLYNGGAAAVGNIGVPALTTPNKLTFPFTINPNLNSLNDFDPNLRMGYVQSWSFGIQREINRDTAFEIRYVANHGTSLWRQYDLNELNTLNNGFLSEFTAAQNNLKICGTSFAPGCGVGAVALPIFTASFGSATSSNFTSQTFLTFLQQGQLGNAANTLARTQSFVTNRINSGISGISSPNFWMVNGASFGGDFLTTNGGDSNYNSLQVELRRRLSKGLLFQLNYVWAHALSNGFASSSASFYQPRTFSNPSLDKGPTPWNIANTFKANFIYELPFGPGRRWSFANGDMGTKIMNKAIEGWQIDGITRIQSGTENLLTSGRFTVNGNDSGVVLNGITAQQLQSLVGVYPSQIPCAAASATCAPNSSSPTGFVTPVVYFLPPNLAQNSACAFAACQTGTTFAPGSPYIGPAQTAGQFGQFIYLRGPMFWNIDASVVKKTKITERVSVEMRFEATNLLNHTNFLIGSAANDLNTSGVGASSFGQTTNFFNDLTGTNDVGARMIRWVFRVNF